MDTDMLSSPLRNAISREVSNAISTSQQDLLNSIYGIMDSKLTNLQTTLQESQQEISQTQMAKMEETLTDNYTFQRGRATKTNSNSSQLGWKVVNEYVANPIAEDSEDERKMLRAQSRAERKSKAEKTKKSIKPRQVPYARNADKDDSFKPGKCFNCGKRGHWADNCPDRKQKINDGLGGGKDFESCQKSSQFVKFQLQKLGFLIAHEKCVWDPCQKLKWLGFIWNTETGRIFVSPERIDKAEQTVNYILSEIGRGKVLLKARILAGIVGQLISMQIVFGDLVRLRTRFLYACVNGRASWEASVKITSEAIDELEFWRVSCRARNSKGVNISTVNFHDNFDVDLFCDASCLGLRQHVVEIVEKSTVGCSGELGKLAEKMSVYLIQSKSDNTTKKYFASYNRWRSFAQGYGFNELPADPIHVSLFLTLLIDKKSSPCTLDSIIYALKWVHELYGYVDPTNNAYIHSLAQSCKRLNGKPVVKKDPVTSDIILELCKINEFENDLLIVRDLTMILIGYAGFLRYDELSSITCRDVKIFDDHISIFLPRSKTDQYRQGGKKMRFRS
ncbi:Hypothetical predicted protein [Mytilus galloprovincialis]|uniref:CCHC-type domain-containing protein n=1 Tax=Mytilus galloprovincialis TaxID=29158 RepID=A0A8B6EBV8_MYTGA|nr:Hypothetical predicted protein [Mytilus galloprovincialis]